MTQKKSYHKIKKIGESAKKLDIHTDIIYNVITIKKYKKPTGGKEMKFYKKHHVELSDYTYNYAQYDFGSLREVIDGSAEMWYSRDDDTYYAIDHEVVRFYDDLDNAITNLEEIKIVLQDVVTKLYNSDAASVVDYWITDHFYQSLDDEYEMIRLFARWEDARNSFIEMITMEAVKNQTYEPLLDEFVRDIF